LHDGRQLRTRASVEYAETHRSRQTSDVGVTIPNQRIPIISSILSIVGGVVVSAAADNAARASSTAAVPLYWIGLLAIFVPISIRLLGGRATDRERMLLVLTLYLTLYLVSFMQSPLLFTTHDSLGQIRSAEDIVTTGHLFHLNPIVPAYASYPGIQLATSSLAQVSGLSLFASGVILVGAARAVLAISLFAAMERLMDARAAGIASLVYATNLSFLSFDAQFAYESLALPLAFLIVAVLVRRPRYGPRSEGIIVLFLTCSVVVTHFATTIWLLVLMIAWVLIDSLSSISRADSLSITSRIARPPRWIAPLGFAIALVWFFVVSRKTTVTELGPVVSSASSSIVGLVGGKSAAKHMFTPSSGPSDGLVLQAIGFLSVGVLLALVAMCIWHLRRVREPIKIVLLILMLMYPMSLVLRLTSAGTETSQRASEFVFLGIGFGVAALSARWPPADRSYQHLGAVLAVLVFVGGIVVGTAPYSRLPGPYLVEADPRSIDAQTIAAASWVRANVPPGSVFAADRDNALALTAIGLVDPAQGLQRGQSIPYLYFSSTFNSRDQATIQAFGIQYILVDLRLSTGLPNVGIYFSPDEPVADHSEPIPRADLTKFATVPGLTRIYDDGEIQIYQVETKADS
jgi:hypothetical protein